MLTEQPLAFENARQWRAWLEENGAAAREAWLLHCKKGSGKASLGLAEAVEEALCFGWVDGKLKSLDKDYFILRYSPRQPGSVWSKINRDRAERLISEGRMAPAGLAAVAEAKKRGAWDAAYTNKTADAPPPGLLKALEENPPARRNFEAFANTYRNMYTGWVAAAKTEETRQKRIREVVRRSALNLKPGV